MDLLARRFAYMDAAARITWTAWSGALCATAGTARLWLLAGLAVLDAAEGRAWTDVQ